jgi:hypothetical protein
MYFVAAL